MLNCYWAPIRSSRGVVLSIIVCAKEQQSNSYNYGNGNRNGNSNNSWMEKDVVYQHVIRQITDIIEGSCLLNADPLNIDVMELYPFTTMFEKARKLQSSTFGVGVRMAKASLMWLLAGTKFHMVCPPLKKALSDFHSPSDYCKFCQSLCMVLDCTLMESDAIEKLCQHLYHDQKIDYGIHRSNESLLTCYVPDLYSKLSLAFIDSNDGGYAMAAKQLKARKQQEQQQQGNCR